MIPELALRDRQRWFATATTHGGGVVTGAARASELLGRALPIDACVTAGPNLSAAERLAIYADGYVGRLIECLADDYPAVAYLVGDDAFASLCRDYVEKHPSRSPSLNAYGRDLAAFVQTRREPWSAFAADLARLEWALVEVVHAPASSRLDPNALATMPREQWKTARLVPGSTFRLLSFDHAVNHYFQAFLDGHAPYEPGERRETWTAVYRDGLTLWRMDLEPAAAALLGELVSGSPLDAAVSELARRTADPADLARCLPVWLSSWVANGFFSAID